MLVVRAAITSTAKVVATGCRLSAVIPRAKIHASCVSSRDNKIPPFTSSIPAQPVWSVQDLLPADEGGNTTSTIDISDEVIERLAKLSHLKIPLKDIESRKTDIATILRFVRAVQDVDTVDVKPLHSVLELDSHPDTSRQQQNGNSDNEDCNAASCSLREDVPTSRATAQDIMANSPEALEGFFVAPKERHFGEQ